MTHIFFSLQAALLLAVLAMLGLLCDMLNDYFKQRSWAVLYTLSCLLVGFVIIASLILYNLCSYFS